MWHNVLHYIGVDNLSGPWYGLWSGWGSQLTPSPIQILAVLMLWKRLQCHDDNCKRIGTHHVPGTHYVTCKQHHPIHQDGKKITHQHIREAYERANGLTRVGLTRVAHLPDNTRPEWLIKEDWNS